MDQLTSIGVNVSVHNDLLLRGNQLVIPACLQRDILRYLHDGHPGISKTRTHASSSVWWPGISRDIEKMMKDCNTCEKFRQGRIEPMIGTEFPDRPWSRIAADFFMHKGHTYLIVIDYYSRDVEICVVTKNVDTRKPSPSSRKCSVGMTFVLFCSAITALNLILRSSSSSLEIGVFSISHLLRDMLSPMVRRREVYRQ